MEATTGSEEAPDDHVALWKQEIPLGCSEEVARALRVAVLNLELSYADLSAVMKIGLGPLLMAHSESHGETRTNEAKDILVNKEVSATMATGSLPGLRSWHHGEKGCAPGISGRHNCRGNGKKRLGDNI